MTQKPCNFLFSSSYIQKQWQMIPADNLWSIWWGKSGVFQQMTDFLSLPSQKYFYPTIWTKKIPMCVTKNYKKDIPLDQNNHSCLYHRVLKCFLFFFSSIFLFLIFFFKKYIFHHCCRIIIPCKSLYVWVSSWPLTAFTSWIYGISCKSFKEVWLLPLRCRAVYNPGASCNVLSKILCSHWTDYSRFTTFYHRPDCYWLDLFSSISHHKSCMNREECWTLLKWIPRCLAHVILNNINSY